MRKIARQYHPIIPLSAFLLFLALVVAARFHLFPFSFLDKNMVQNSVSVTVAPVRIINKPLWIARPGSVENSTSVPIHTDYSGILSEIYVKTGQAVKAGHPLAKLQGTSASRESPSAGSLNRGIAQESYDKALNDVNRYQKLYEQGAIPRRQLETALTRLQQAQEELNNAQNSTAGGNTSDAMTTLHGSATVTAPIDGIVTGLSVTPGNTVQAGQQLLALGSGQEVEVIVHLNQNDLYLVHLGTKAMIELTDQMVMGQVSSIYPEVDGEQISSFIAHIKLTDNPKDLLQPGNSVNVRMDTGKTENVRVIPADSVFQDEQGRNFIFIAVNHVAVSRQVTIGERTGDFTEVTSALPQESMVITTRVREIKNGDAITVIQ
ncbi:hypothetical protein P22_0259 [Propionispora sp. 2/2-37]|uniref:efflux RND transporter periplasmic adaptor subunit n=1 Tax=Propionispora sp. 2/2-37 TaxID=1677858 RepID=UPI0006BB75C1|nr:efflux RND transporter periplasmic adaptor subunit [Propionispora sp. 2/2-37]CUH94193.1 hypothetical protein P22_0259 [Propionispora sp. 2/2-37]